MLSLLTSHARLVLHNVISSTLHFHTASQVSLKMFPPQYLIGRDSLLVRITDNHMLWDECYYDLRYIVMNSFVYMLSSATVTGTIFLFKWEIDTEHSVFNSYLLVIENRRICNYSRWGSFIE